MAISAIALAAGEGKRMKSALPKVMHSICGKPLIDYVIDAFSEAGVTRISVVVDAQADALKRHLEGRVTCIDQDFTKGRGNAKAAEAALAEDMDGAVLVLCGDMPLVRPETLKKLHESVVAGNACALCYVTLAEPRDGRVELDANGRPMRIIEHKDITPETPHIHTINSSIYCFDGKKLSAALKTVTPNAISGEYYITDVIDAMYRAGETMAAFEVDGDEGIGVNDRVQLAQAEAAMRSRVNKRIMNAGVTLIDPSHTYVGADVEVGADTVIHPNCTLSGGTRIGARCTLLPGCRVDNSIIGDDVTIESSVITNATVDSNTTIGPFAYLRPDSHVGSGVKIGDFVEIKNSTVGDDTKISHLAYVGDANLGKDINVSCGVIFSNYDGKRKHRSTVDDHAFIGCNTNIISPVHVGAEAYIAAGSTVTKDVPDGALLIARERETIKEGWVHQRKLEGKL